MKKAVLTTVLSASFIAGAVASPISTSAAPIASGNAVPTTYVNSQSRILNNVSQTNAPSLPIGSPVSPPNAGGVSEQNIVSNVIKKAITNALRYGGPFMNKLLSKVSPSAGKYVEKYSGKLADFLDSITDWQEGTVASFLVGLGVPPAEAANIAYYIVFLAG